MSWPARGQDHHRGSTARRAPAGRTGSRIVPGARGSAPPGRDRRASPRAPRSRTGEPDRPGPEVPPISVPPCGAGPRPHDAPRARNARNPSSTMNRTPEIGDRPWHAGYATTSRAPSSPITANQRGSPARPPPPPRPSRSLQGDHADQDRRRIGADQMGQARGGRGWPSTAEITGSPASIVRRRSRPAREPRVTAAPPWASLRRWSARSAPWFPVAPVVRDGEPRVLHRPRSSAPRRSASDSVDAAVDRLAGLAVGGGDRCSVYSGLVADVAVHGPQRRQCQHRPAAWATTSRSSSTAARRGQWPRRGHRAASRTTRSLSLWAASLKLRRSPAGRPGDAPQLGATGGARARRSAGLRPGGGVTDPRPGSRGASEPLGGAPLERQRDLRQLPGGSPGRDTAGTAGRRPSDSAGAASPPARIDRTADHGGGLDWRAPGRRPAPFRAVGAAPPRSAPQEVEAGPHGASATGPRPATVGCDRRASSAGAGRREPVDSGSVPRGGSRSRAFGPQASPRAPGALRDARASVDAGRFPAATSAAPWSVGGESSKSPGFHGGFRDPPTPAKIGRRP